MQLKVTLLGDDLGVFDPDEIDMDSAMQLEDKTGMTVIELGNELSRGSSKAMQALVWLICLIEGKPAELHRNFKFKDIATERLDLEPESAGDVADPPLAVVKTAKTAKAA